MSWLIRAVQGAQAASGRAEVRAGGGGGGQLGRALHRARAVRVGLAQSLDRILWRAKGACAVCNAAATNIEARQKIGGRGHALQAQVACRLRVATDQQARSTALQICDGRWRMRGKT